VPHIEAHGRRTLLDGAAGRRPALDGKRVAVAAGHLQPPPKRVEAGEAGVAPQARACFESGAILDQRGIDAQAQAAARLKETRANSLQAKHRST